MKHKRTKRVPSASPLCQITPLSEEKETYVNPGNERKICGTSALFQTDASRLPGLYQHTGQMAMELFPSQRIEERKKRELLLETLAEIEAERNDLKQQLVEYKAALLLSRREREEMTNPRLRLLKVLRNKACRRIIEEVTTHGQVDLETFGPDLQSLELLVELINLDKLVCIGRIFVPTEAGKRTFEKYRA